MGILKDIGTFFDMLINPEEYKDTGHAGERFTYRILDDTFIPEQILRNVYIKKEDGKYTEIDLVVVCRKGLIVCESKNYSGTIYGNINDSYWTQFIRKNSKHKFLNPIFQNEGHIKALKHTLPAFTNLNFFSIVVFSDRCTIKNINYTPENTYVIKREDLDNVIKMLVKSKQDTLSNTERDEIISILSAASRPETEVKEQHLADVKDTMNQCPFCKSPLVEKKNKKTGQSFLGCNNFPKCKYTRQIKA